MSDNPPFSDEQKEYLQGFLSGAGKAREALGMPPLPSVPNGQLPGAAGAGGEAVSAGPDGLQFKAQNRFLAAGKKLTAEDQAKRDGHPFDMWDEIVANAKAGAFPKGTDVFKYKILRALFYRPEPEGVHVPVEAAERRSECLAVQGPRRSRRTLWRRLCPCHHPRQFADPRNRGRAQRRLSGGPVRAWHHLEGLRRGQYQEHHRFPHRRHRWGRVDRHPPAGAGDPALHPEPARFLRPAAKVQHRL